MKGKRLPLIGRIEISIIEESNPRLLAFEKGDLDYVTVPGDLVANVLDLGNGLQPRFAKAGVKLARGIQPAITYTYFNMEDPVVGGYTQDKDRAAPRVRHGLQRRGGDPHPPAGAGGVRDAADSAGRHRLRSEVRRPRPLRRRRREGAARQVRLRRPRRRRLARPSRRQAARDLDGNDDRRARPPVRGDVAAQPERDRRQGASSSSRSGRSSSRWALAGQLQMWYLGNISTTTDGYGFLGLLYGGHAGLSNLSRFKQPDFDRLYDRSRSMPDGPERTKVIPRDVGDRVGLRAVVFRRLPLRERRSLPMGHRLQAQRLPAASVAVLRHRHEDAASAVAQ